MLCLIFGYPNFTTTTSYSSLTMKWHLGWLHRTDLVGLTYYQSHPISFTYYHLSNSTLMLITEPIWKWLVHLFLSESDLFIFFLSCTTFQEIYKPIYWHVNYWDGQQGHPKSIDEEVEWWGQKLSTNVASGGCGRWVVAFILAGCPQLKSNCKT